MDRIHNRCEIEVAGSDLVKHGRQQEEVLTIDERHHDGGISSDFLFQFHGNRKPGKPSAKNEYPFNWSIFHRCLAITL